MNKKEAIEKMISEVRNIEQTEHIENYKNEKAMQTAVVKKIIGKLKEVTGDENKKS